jgi:hypothetical protein
MFLYVERNLTYFVPGDKLLTTHSDIAKFQNLCINKKSRTGLALYPAL